MRFEVETVFTKFTLALLAIFTMFGEVIALEEKDSPSCGVSKVSLQVLGAGGPELNDGFAAPSFIVWQNGKARILVETGPGSSVGFDKYGAALDDLEAILLSHLHVDHSADFPAYVKGAFFTPRERALNVYGPDGNALMPSTTDFVERLFGPNGVYPYLQDNLPNDADTSNFHIKAHNVPIDTQEFQRYPLTDNITISAIATHHGPVASIAWRVEIDGCILVFSGDMSNKTNRLEKLARGADLLIANAAIPEWAKGVARNLHMPPSEIGKIASQAGVGRILISHLMRRTQSVLSDSTKVIAKHYKGEVLVANDGLKVSLKESEN
jgi:ribonuclease BN (tRNA processing enzyme)